MTAPRGIRITAVVALRQSEVGDGYSSTTSTSAASRIAGMAASPNMLANQGGFLLLAAVGSVACTDRRGSFLRCVTTVPRAYGPLRAVHR